MTMVVGGVLAVVGGCSGGGDGSFGDPDAASEASQNDVTSVTRDSSRPDSANGSTDGGPSDADANSLNDANGDANGQGFDASSFPALDAAPFTIDTTYGTGGVTKINFGGPGLGLVNVSVRQPDGSLIVGGSSGSGGMLLRYSATGVFDTTFGTSGDGVVSIPLGVSVQMGGLALQSADQKIVVSGQFNSPNNTSKTFLARFLPTGAPDLTFGTNGNGRVIADGFGVSLALEPTSGAMVVAANAIGGLTVYRFTMAGAPDATFGTAGVATISGIGGIIGQTLIQADGKILVSGGNYPKSFLVRLTSTGVLDTTWNGTGKLEEFGGGGKSSEALALAQQLDGKLLVAGGGDGSYGVGRYTLTGARDNTFGGPTIQGWSTRPGIGLAEAISIQNDGNILTAGIAEAILVARYRSDGGIDVGFGDGGATKLPFDNAQTPMVLQPDGTIMVAGSSYNNGPYAGGDAVITRLLPSGAFDATYGDGGVIKTTNISGSNDRGLGVTVQNDGKAIVVGSAGPNFGSLVRLTSTGALDTSFGTAGTAGITTIDNALPFTNFPKQQLRGTGVQSTGKILVTGSDANLQIARFDTAGVLDTTFGTSGIASIPSSPNGNGALGSGFAMGPAGSGAAADTFVIAGGTSTSVSTAFLVVKFTADGQPDATFGSSKGVETPANKFGTSVVGAGAVAIQGDGKIVAAGFAEPQSFAIVRYTTTGALDTTFGAAGTGVVTLDIGAHPVASGMVVQPDGAIVVLSRRANKNDTTDAILLRFTSGGALDPTFGVNGVAGYPLGKVEHPPSPYPFPIGLARRASDGKIFVAGSVCNDDVKMNILLLRFDTTGHLDAKSEIPISAGADTGHDLAIQSDGKVIVTGRTWTHAGGRDLYALRLLPPP